MGMIYFLDLIQSDAQVGTAVDTLTLKQPEAIESFLQNMGRVNLAVPSPRFAAFASKVNKVCGGDVRFLGGNHSEDIEWAEGDPLHLQGPGAKRAKWSLSFEDEVFDKLMPIVLVWARIARIDVHDPQKGAYFAWRDPHGMARIQDPLAPDETYDQLLVNVQVWAAKIAAPPATVSGIEALVEKLTGKQIKGRRFYQSMAEKLWGKLVATDPSVKDPLEVFGRDPREWGGDESAPCSAIWTLNIRTRHYALVLQTLKALAAEKQLCFWVAASGEAYVPDGQPASVSPASTAPAVLKDAAHLGAEPALSLNSEGPLKLRKVVRETEDGRIQVLLVRDDSASVGEINQSGTGLLGSILAEAIRDTQTAPVIAVMEASLKGHDFRRKGVDRLEKRYPAGVMGLQVLTETLPEGRCGVQVLLTVDYAATLRVLKRAGLPPGDVDLAKHTLVADLRVFEALTSGEDGAGAGLIEYDHMFTFAPQDVLNEQVEAWVLPVVKRILAEDVPWFMQPAKYMGVLHRSFMAGQSWPAGLTATNMEDIILARLCDLKDWEAYWKRRVEEARAKKAGSRSKPEALERMGAYVKAKVAPDEILAKAAHQSGNGGALGQLAWAWIALLFFLLVSSKVELPKAMSTVMIVGWMVYLAWQLFRLGGRTNMRFLLPITALFPPATLLVMVFYWLRGQR